MTRIYSEFKTRHLDNDRFVQMAAPFRFASDELLKAGFSAVAEIPAGFIMDGESVPVVRGRNVRGGGVHDYLSCYDSVPVVTKAVAAAVYLEINAYTDSIDHGRNYLVMAKDFLRRWTKWGVVYVWPGYFHKRSIYATCEELYGFKGDPYRTVEKLEAAIEESKEATAAIKAVPDAVEEKPAMVEASEKVTADLKDAKADVIEKVENVT